MGISGISYTNAFSLGPVKPALTYPVSKVSKVTPVTEQVNSTDLVSNESDSIPDSFKSMLKAYSQTDNISYQSGNPYEYAKKTIDYSLVSGMNFDATV